MQKKLAPRRKDAKKSVPKKNCYAGQAPSPIGECLPTPPKSFFPFPLCVSASLRLCVKIPLKSYGLDPIFMGLEAAGIFADAI